MSTQKSPTLHPMLWLAAASVTAVSLAGVAKLAGFMPASGEAPAPALAAAPAPAVEPASPPAAKSPPLSHETRPHRLVTATRESARPVPAPTSVASQPPADAVPAPPPPPRADAAPRRVADAPPSICRDCGVIESIEAVQQKGEGSGLGAVGGAILGGVLGHQVGEGSGKQIARIGGAVLGGLAGNEVEKRYRAISHYRIGVRMEDGTYRVVEQQNAPAWRRGDAVHLDNGGIVAGGAAPAAGSSAF